MSRVMKIVGCLAITALSMKFIGTALEERDRLTTEIGYKSGYNAGSSRAITSAKDELDNILDTESNQFAIRNTLRDEDTFIRLSSLIESAEPPIVRPTIWEVMANYLLHKSPEEPIGVTMNGVLKKFKLSELKFDKNSLHFITN